MALNPFYSIIAVIVIVFLAAITLLIKNKKTNIAIVLSGILLLPVALYEYITLFWFWGGDGIFIFFTVPLAYILYIVLHLAILKKHRENKLASIIGKFSMVIVTPILTIATIYLISKVFNIDIHIQ